MVDISEKLVIEAEDRFLEDDTIKKFLEDNKKRKGPVSTYELKRMLLYAFRLGMIQGLDFGKLIFDNASHTELKKH